MDGAYANRIAFKNNSRALNSLKAQHLTTSSRDGALRLNFVVKKGKDCVILAWGEKKKCGLSQVMQNAVMCGVFQDCWPPWQQQTLMWLSESSSEKEKRQCNLKRRKHFVHLNFMKTNNLYIKKNNWHQSDVKKRNVAYRLKIHHKCHNSNNRHPLGQRKKNLLQRSLSVCLGQVQETLWRLFSPRITPFFQQSRGFTVEKKI